MKLWLIQLGWTLRTFAGRRRTYLGFAIFVLFDLLVLGMMQSENIRDAARTFYLKYPQYSAPENFSGLTVARFILSQSLNLVGGLYLALVAGDVVAMEVEEGTVRTLLSRPVSRGRLLCHRAIVCIVYTFALVFFLAVVALGCGLLDRGSGNLLIVFPGERVPVAYAFWPGLVRYLLAIPLQAASLLTVTALAFMLSCTPMKPQAAAITALSIYLTDRFLHGASIFRSIRPYLMTTRMEEWIGIYRPQIPWESLLENCGQLLCLDFALIMVGWWVFRRRDLKP